MTEEKKRTCVAKLRPEAASAFVDNRSVIAGALGLTGDEAVSIALELARKVVEPIFDGESTDLLVDVPNEGPFVVMMKEISDARKYGEQLRAEQAKKVISFKPRT